MENIKQTDISALLIQEINSLEVETEKMDFIDLFEKFRKEILLYTIVAVARNDKNQTLAENLLKELDDEVSRFYVNNYNPYSKYKLTLMPTEWDSFEMISRIVNFLDCDERNKKLVKVMSEMVCRVSKSFSNNYKMNGMVVNNLSIKIMYTTLYKEIQGPTRHSTNKETPLKELFGDLILTTCVAMLDESRNNVIVEGVNGITGHIKRKLIMILTIRERLLDQVSDISTINKGLKVEYTNIIKETLSLLGFSKQQLKSEEAFEHIQELSNSDYILKIYEKYIKRYDEYKSLHSIIHPFPYNNNLYEYLEQNEKGLPILDLNVNSTKDCRQVKLEVNRSLIKYTKAFAMRGMVITDVPNSVIKFEDIERSLISTIETFQDNKTHIAEFLTHFYFMYRESVYVNNLKTALESKTSYNKSVKVVKEFDEYAMEELKELRNTNFNLVTKLEGLEDTKTSLAEKERELKRMELELEKSRSINKQLTDEVYSLEEKVQSLEQLISSEGLESEGDTKDELDSFMQITEGKRVFLVGGYDNWANNIKSKVPSITLIRADSLSKDIQMKFKSGEVIAILVTPYNSHSMARKIKSAVQSNSSNKLININEHLNFNRFLTECNKELQI